MKYIKFCIITLFVFFSFYAQALSINCGTLSTEECGKFSQEVEGNLYSTAVTRFLNNRDGFSVVVLSLIFILIIYVLFRLYKFLKRKNTSFSKFDSNKIANSNLIIYIKEQLSFGTPLELITSRLKNEAGFSDQNIIDALSSIKYYESSSNIVHTYSRWDIRSSEFSKFERWFFLITGITLSICFCIGIVIIFRSPKVIINNFLFCLTLLFFVFIIYVHIKSFFKQKTLASVIISIIFMVITYYPTLVVATNGVAKNYPLGVFLFFLPIILFFLSILFKKFSKIFIIITQAFLAPASLLFMFISYFFSLSL